MNDEPIQKKTEFPTSDVLRKKLKEEAEVLREEKKARKKLTKSDVLKEILPDLKELRKEFSVPDIVKMLKKSGLATSSGTVKSVLSEEGSKPSRKRKNRSRASSDRQNDVSAGERANEMPSAHPHSGFASSPGQSFGG